MVSSVPFRQFGKVINNRIVERNASGMNIFIDFAECRFDAFDESLMVDIVYLASVELSIHEAQSLSLSEFRHLHDFIVSYVVSSLDKLPESVCHNLMLRECRVSLAAVI